MKRLLAVISILMLFPLSVFSETRVPADSVYSWRALEVKEKLLLDIKNNIELHVIPNITATLNVSTSDMSILVSEIRRFNKEKAEADTSLRMLFGIVTSVQLNSRILELELAYTDHFPLWRDSDGRVRTILTALTGMPIESVDEVIPFGNLVLFCALLIIFVLFMVNGIAQKEIVLFVGACIVLFLLLTIIVVNGGY